MVPLTIQENYGGRFTQIDELSQAADVLSDAFYLSRRRRTYNSVLPATTLLRVSNTMPRLTVRLLGWLQSSTYPDKYVASLAGRALPAMNHHPASGKFGKNAVTKPLRFAVGRAATANAAIASALACVLHDPVLAGPSSDARTGHGVTAILGTRVSVDGHGAGAT